MGFSLMRKIVLLDRRSSVSVSGTYGSDRGNRKHVHNTLSGRFRLNFLFYSDKAQTTENNQGNVFA